MHATECTRVASLLYMYNVAIGRLKIRGPGMYNIMYEIFWGSTPIPRPLLWRILLLIKYNA